MVCKVKIEESNNSMDPTTRVNLKIDSDPKYNGCVL